MSRATFNALVADIAAIIGERELGADLENHLNARAPAAGPLFKSLQAICAEGEAEGWVANREAGGVKFSRPVKPGAEAGRFSVDVVRMRDIKGPHHVHTTGEIGAIMPITENAKFDGRGAGWYVYPPGSAHHPTVTDGDAYILYLLPDGAIEFTGK